MVLSLEDCCVLLRALKPALGPQSQWPQDLGDKKGSRETCLRWAEAFPVRLRQPSRTAVWQPLLIGGSQDTGGRNSWCFSNRGDLECWGRGGSEN